MKLKRVRNKMYKKIIAIGGGEIGRPGHPIETLEIDKEIVKLTGKKNPRLLFIPTASGDSESYFETVKKYFGYKLDCGVDVLYLIKERLSKKEIEKKIFASDIIYVGGGDTLKMITLWKKLGVDRLLIEAYKKGIIMSGISAGAICWFKYGNSDSKLKETGKLVKVPGLGFVKVSLCPHYDQEKKRRPALKEMTKNDKIIAIAIDNCCAIEIINEKYRIISSKTSANAYRVYWKENIYYEEIIKKERKLKPLKELLIK